METLEHIKILMERLSIDTNKFFKGNASAGRRSRKTAQEIKSLLQALRIEINNHRKENNTEK
jgi:hypothetical protein